MNSDVTHDPSRRELAVFALLWLAFFGAAGALVLWRPEGLLGAAGMMTVAWLASLAFNSDMPRRRQLIGVALPTLFAVAGAGGRTSFAWPVAVALWTLGAAGTLVIAASAEAGRRLWRGWMTAALPIGWSISHLILAVVYFLVLTPIGVLLRWAGRDPLRKGFDRQAQSFWVERRRRSDPRSYFRQF